MNRSVSCDPELVRRGNAALKRNQLLHAQRTVVVYEARCFRTQYWRILAKKAGVPAERDQARGVKNVPPARPFDNSLQKLV